VFLPPGAENPSYATGTYTIQSAVSKETRISSLRQLVGRRRQQHAGPDDDDVMKDRGWGDAYEGTPKLNSLHVAYCTGGINLITTRDSLATAFAMRQRRGGNYNSGRGRD